MNEMESKKMNLFQNTESNKSLMENLKYNWIFPISALFFFGLNSWNLIEYLIGVVIAFVINILFSLKCGRLTDIFKNSSNVNRIFSLFSSIGICLFGHDLFCMLWAKQIIYDTTTHIPFLSYETASMIGWAGAVFSFCFVYFSLLMFYGKLKKIFKEYELLNGIGKGEIIVYCIIILFTFGFVLYAFLNSQLFYGTEYISDVLYTSDSHMLVELNAYLNLTHIENDLRQPLFAVFSSPLLGITYLLGFPFDYTVRSLILDFAQIILMMFSNFILAKLLRLTGIKRISFVVLLSSTYSYLLFSIMMEQYIIAYFYLILCIYVHYADKKIDAFLLYASAGTLLTSSIVIPIVLWKKHCGDYISWLKALVRYITGFLVLMLGFGRFDVIYHLLDRIVYFTAFSGQKVSMVNKILQYFEFIRSIFITPINEILISSNGDITWGLSQIDSIDIIGISILTLAIVSFVLNRKKNNAKIFMAWVVFSVFILIVMGWGTYENGLTLYILYFGWAFISLIY